MAKVPYNPVPQATLAGGGSPRLAPQGVEGAFGEQIAAASKTVAAATSHLGETVGKLGDEVFKRAYAMQELANQTEAKDAETEYVIRAGKMRADFSSLQGKAAVEAYPQYMQDLKAEREAVRKMLSNDASRKLYDAPTMNTMSYTIYNGAGHAAQENKKWALGSATARVETNRTNVLTNPEDDLTFRRSLVDSHKQVNVAADLNGWGPEQTKMKQDEVTSTLVLSRISALSRDEPFKAQDMLTKMKENGLLRGDDIDKADKAVKQSVLQVGTRVIADKIEQSDPDQTMSLQDRLAKGRTDVERMAPGDVVAKDYVEQRIHADWNRRQQAKKDDTYNRRNVVEGGLMGGESGEKPTTPEELFGTGPGVEAAWRALDNPTKRIYMDRLAKNAKGDVSWSEERLIRYQEMKGLISTDPTKFLDTNVIKEDLPPSAIKELINQQFKMKEKAEGDPRVMKALQILAPELNAAGISKRNSERTYLQFSGGLQDAISDFQKTNNRTPKAEEVQTIGRRLLQEQATGRPGWLSSLTLGLIPTQERGRLFENSVPEKDMEEIRTNPKWEQMGITPTEEVIQRIYVREQFRKFYGGAPSAAKPTGSPTPPISGRAR